MNSWARIALGGICWTLLKALLRWDEPNNSTQFIRRQHKVLKASKYQHCNQVLMDRADWTMECSAFAPAKYQTYKRQPGRGILKDSKFSSHHLCFVRDGVLGFIAFNGTRLFKISQVRPVVPTPWTGIQGATESSQGEPQNPHQSPLLIQCIVL